MTFHVPYSIVGSHGEEREVIALICEGTCVGGTYTGNLIQGPLGFLSARQPVLDHRSDPSLRRV